MPVPYLTEAEAQALYTTGDAAHDFDHVLRVTRLATLIATAEGADVEVVRLAALLHDVPRTDAPTAHAARLAHHLAAAQFAGELLLARGMAPERVQNVVHAIEAHRFRDQTIRPNTVEAKCLYDADKLDSIGAIGVARAFAFAGAHNNRLWTEPWREAPPDDAKPEGGDYTPVHEFVYKLQRILATLFTETGRKLGARRHAAMVAFYDQLDAEMLDLD
ncbi:MAG: HD domain-containing protein [Anaerolineales bacterium]|nr:HD domain-containing protein [Anaerolineales bacterium]